MRYLPPEATFWGVVRGATDEKPDNVISIREFVAANRGKLKEVGDG